MITHGVTDNDIHELMHDAADRGDAHLVHRCHSALNGNRVAWAECACIVKSRRETLRAVPVAAVA